MLDSDSFFPFIRDAAWPSLSDCCVRPLLKTRQDLYIAFGQQGAKNTTYLTMVGQKESGVNDAEVYRRAVTNLRNRPSKPKWMLNTIGDETFMLRSGDELVSSDILSSKGMRKLNEFFAAQRVAIGMPSHFAMVAAANADLLKGIIVGMYNQAQKDAGGPLSKHIFYIEQGLLVDEQPLSPTTRTVANVPAQDVALSIALGLAAVTIFVAKAKGSLNDQSGSIFWTEFNRRFGVAHGDLAALIASAEQPYREAMATPESPGSRVTGITVMAAVLRGKLKPEELQRVIEAIFKTAMHLGEMGTGIFGIGRKFPEEMRPLVWCLSGLLGVEPMTF